MTLVANGLGDKQIAAALEISPRTVKFHVSSALRKSGEENRSGLAVWWFREGREAASGARARAPAGPSAPASALLDAGAADGLMRHCVARIERELKTLSEVAAERVTRLEQVERELLAVSSARDCVAQLEKAFEALKASIAAGGQECPLSGTS